MSLTTTITVWCDLAGRTERVGTAWVNERRQAATTFGYDPSWQADPRSYAISPDLALTSARHHVTGLPGALADSSPDRWGRNLVAKRTRARAREAGSPPAQIMEVDFLLGVSDLTRQGALRFTTGSDGPLLAAGADVPKLIELPRLLRAADAVATDDDSMAAVKELLDAGTGSLGGARPKGSVRDGDRLAIAKFPHHADEWDVMAWEKTVLDLAQRAGIRVPTRRLVVIDHRHALVVDRFDRTPTGRVGYVSAMTLVGGTDGTSYDYLEVVEAMTEHGGNVKADLAELWRRIAFSLLVNNTDDHLRNLGFLHHTGGWCLSPAFDINPNPNPTALPQTTVAFVSGDRTQRLDALLDARDVFGLSSADATAMLKEVAGVVLGWRAAAAANGIPGREVDRFDECFEGLAAAVS